MSQKIPRSYIYTSTPKHFECFVCQIFLKKSILVSLEVVRANNRSFLQKLFTREEINVELS